MHVKNKISNIKKVVFLIITTNEISTFHFQQKLKGKISRIQLWVADLQVIQKGKPHLYLPYQGLCLSDSFTLLYMDVFILHNSVGRLFSTRVGGDMQYFSPLDFLNIKKNLLFLWSILIQMAAFHHSEVIHSYHIFICPLTLIAAH